MIGERLVALLEARVPRGYVGRHRAPRYLRYIGAARVQQPDLPATVQQPDVPAAEPDSRS